MTPLEAIATTAAVFSAPPAMICAALAATMLLCFFVREDDPHGWLAAFLVYGLWALLFGGLSSAALFLAYLLPGGWV